MSDETELEVIFDQYDEESKMQLTLIAKKIKEKKGKKTKTIKTLMKVMSIPINDDENKWRCYIVLTRIDCDELTWSKDEPDFFNNQELIDAIDATYSLFWRNGWPTDQVILSSQGDKKDIKELHNKSVELGKKLLKCFLESAYELQDLTAKFKARDNPFA